ncbi:hypothetical protein [Micromonospora chalcea]|uniref:hypothetical protein n=1 Tax=Micromonospora chalcea TaxID=1874 RepID=UPI0004C3D9C9|nr:hypothetical protein [Micromonospora purpureochromogenes]
MTTTTASAPRPDTRTRLDPAAPLAAAWLGGWGVLALLSALTGAGYPFGTNDPHGGDAAGLLRLLPGSVGPPLFAAVLLTGAVAALAMTGPARRPSRPVRLLITGYATAVALALAVVVPGMRVLALLGYAPMLLIGAPFGWPPVDYADVFTWPLFARLAALAGGMLLAGALLRWRRRIADGSAPGWTAPAAAARWGRWATWTAAVVPVLYALTRFAWLAGVPLGMSRETLAEMRADGSIWAGAGLGAFAVVGAVLTLGLVARWGERFPRWMPGLAGRRVPVLLAVIPAGLVALAVLAASLDLLAAPQFAELIREGNSAALPMVLWPVWAVTLAGSAYAYHLRRRA